MMRSKYLLMTVALLSGVVSLLLGCVPLFSEWSGDVVLAGIFIVTILTISALISQKWTVLAALFLALVVSIAGKCWRYILVVAVLANWIVIHILNYVSGIGDWFADLFKVCWLGLFVLALGAPFFRRWREFAAYCLTLVITFSAFTVVLFAPEKGGILPNRWLQEAGFRIYASYLISSMPPEEFISRCKLVDFVEEDGARRRIGECSEGFRSTLWFRIVVIHDPSGQLALPAIQRTLEWRLVVLHLSNGRFFVHDDVARHLDGSFYWIVAPPDLSGDDEK